MKQKINDSKDGADLKQEKRRRMWLFRPYATPFVVTVILLIIISVVCVCYQRISRQFCEERLRTLEAVSSKITVSTHTGFDAQWKTLGYSVRMLQALESDTEGELLDELQTIEDSLGLTDGDGMIYLFDEKGYYYGAEGKIGLWENQKILTAMAEWQLSVTNLPVEGTHSGDFMVFFYRFPEPQTMDGLVVTHMALVRNMVLFDDDLEIGEYGDVDSSYIIRKNGTRIYHQSNNEIFTGVYNVLKALERCQFEHGATIHQIQEDMLFDRSGSAHMVYKGDDYVLAYQPLGVDDWYAVYLVSLHSMSQSTHEFIIQTVVIIGGASIAVLFLCLALICINNIHWRSRLSAGNEQLRAAMEEAKRASSAKSEFLSRMSHDIRTPLNGIIGMTDIALKNIGKPEKICDCLQKISGSSEHLMLLINDVLDMSRIENDKIESHCEMFELRRVLSECTDMLEGRLSEQNIAFYCNYDGIVHNTVQGDKNHLQQILINILGNALKFTPAGGTVSFCVTEDCTDVSRSSYRFEITDTGIGMSREFLEHIFEPFSQEADGPRTDYKGTGLGMSIVKKLVEQMNGDIQVESTKNKGSRFVVVLPMKTIPASDSSDSLGAAETDCTGLHGTVLLVEDSALNREIAEYLLIDAGLTVMSAENGQEAVDIFSDSAPGTIDVVLMDIMMPVMDGLEAARTIRAMDRADAKSVPIIAMTANAYREDEEKSIAAGMNAHLTKPLRINELLRVLKEMIL